VPEDLKLDLQKSGSGVHMLCPICGETFRQLSTAVLLSGTGARLGYLCEKCLEGGPQGAAATVRARAGELRSILNKDGSTYSADDWARLQRSIWKRADAWDALAARLEKMSWQDL
jgi:hypothetical protein